MRIISAFRDYYDSAAGHDEEATPVYVRETSTVLVRAPGGRGRPPDRQDHHHPAAAEAARGLEDELDRMLDMRRYGLFEQVSTLVVGFCGAVARGWRQDDRCYWTASDVLDAIEANPRGYHGSNKEFRADLRYERRDPSGLLHDPPEPFDLARKDPRMTAVFRALDVPCFLFHQANWSGTAIRIVRNPPLGPLGFVRILDPYSARQAVETYLSNELARQEDPQANIADEDMRDMKGFDDRSFKADPGGPGRKRKRRKKRS